MASKKLACLILSSLVLTSSAIALVRMQPRPTSTRTNQPQQPRHTQSLATRSDEANRPAAPEGWYYFHPPADGSPAADSGASTNPERPPPTIQIPSPPARPVSTSRAGSVTTAGFRLWF
ncbi:hypothetical protein DFP72DRAFT_887660 [Ephemerocybe angulata]|uniref:Uncharacterized protein n=1 Tax=Ephemerocybe angulata TaxID=980116 RepID=A0A8H6I6X0_9AGAR|nr:hypothetical protein DFP72DRAFT_887660 [Tulosesus angulatus]